MGRCFYGKYRSLSLLALCLLAIAYALHAILFAPQLRRQLILGDVKSNRTCHFSCPVGHEFSFVFGLTENVRPPHELSGEIALHRNDAAAWLKTARFTSDSLQEANWLDSLGVPSFVLHCNGTKYSWDLNPGRSYQLDVKLTDVPSGSVSVWLCYVTTRYEELLGKRSYSSAAGLRWWARGGDNCRGETVQRLSPWTGVQRIVRQPTLRALARNRATRFGQKWGQR